MTQLLNIKKINLKNILIVFIAILPITLMIGSAVINTFVLLIDFLFLIIIIKEKKINYLNNNTFYLLIFLWTSLIINMLMSSEIDNSISRSFGFFRYILFIFAIKFILNKDKFHDKIIFSCWSLIFLIISFDIIFESLFGFNTLGFNNNLPGRISSFLNDELKIGNYYFGFILLTLSFIFYNFKKNYLFYLSIILFIFIAFLTGERSNFIRIFIISIIFFFIVDKTFLYKKILIISVFFISSILVISQNINYKDRFVTQTITGLSKHNYNIINYIKFSPYGAHYDASLKIFKSYPFFGVGLKNFRMESGKEKYKDSNILFTNFRQSTHPHQVHFELLSETGLFGYLSFFIFFYLFLKKSITFQLKSKNFYQLSGILLILATFLPLIPSGSFFTTYGATIFWLNFAVVESFND